MNYMGFFILLLLLLLWSARCALLPMDGAVLSFYFWHLTDILHPHCIHISVRASMRRETTTSSPGIRSHSHSHVPATRIKS